MARYVLAGMRRQTDLDRGLYCAGATVYVSKSGCTTYSADRAAVIRSMNEAEKEWEYWTTTGAKNYQWTVEELPRGPVSSAVLRATPVYPAYRPA